MKKRFITPALTAFPKRNREDNNPGRFRPIIIKPLSDISSVITAHSTIPPFLFHFPDVIMYLVKTPVLNRFYCQ